MKKIYKKPLKVGIIGTGRISDLHVIEYLSNHSTEIVAVCDSNIERAKQKSIDWNLSDIAIFQDYKDLLKMDEVDLVEILVPHHLHIDVALEAILRKKSISLQKPMCLNISEANRLISEAKKSDVSLKIFENFIFYPPVIKAKELIDEGQIGRPLSIRIKSNPGFSSTAWEVPNDASDKVARGKAAMTLMGTWITGYWNGMDLKPGVDYDFFPFPIMSSGIPNAVVGPVDGLVVSANAKNPSGAKKFLSFMMSNPEVQAQWTDGQGALSANTKVDPTKYNTVMQRALRTVAKAEVYAFNYDLATPPPVAEVGLSMFSEFMDNPANYISILSNAQKNASREFKN